jgi:hypothetical protein
MQGGNRSPQSEYRSAGPRAVTIVFWGGKIAEMKKNIPYLLQMQQRLILGTPELLNS